MPSLPRTAASALHPFHEPAACARAGVFMCGHSKVALHRPEAWRASSLWLKLALTCRPQATYSNLSWLDWVKVCLNPLLHLGVFLVGVSVHVSVCAYMSYIYIYIYIYAYASPRLLLSGLLVCHGRYSSTEQRRRGQGVNRQRSVWEARFVFLLSLILWPQRATTGQTWAARASLVGLVSAESWPAGHVINELPVLHEC